MVGLRIDLTSQVKGLHVGLAAVVNKPGFISVEHAVDAKWEELVIVCLLDKLLALF